MTPSFTTTGVLTFTKKASTSKPREISSQDLIAQDLAALKLSDSFMYYSIPSVRKAALLGKDELSSFETEAIQPHTVTRKSRVSFECHGDLLLEDLLLDLGKDLNEDHLDMVNAFCEQQAEGDLFLSLITHMPSRKRKSKSDPLKTKEDQ